MDAQPAVFPGKRRKGAKSSEVKNGDGVKAPKKPPCQFVTAAQPRPKRAFGVARSTNVPVEKPRLTAKPRKVLAAAPPQPPTGTRKIRAVCIQETKTAAITKTSRKDEHQEAVGTPTSSTKPTVAGTPYLSALNCSKCKLDQLESSTYWLSQIRLAESTGKHFVSAAFFRLALECHAQPLHRLRIELRNYVTRHQVNSMESVWVDLSRAYGLAKGGLDSDSCDLIQHNSLLAEMNGSMDEPDVDLCNLDRGHVSLAEKDGCSEHDDVNGIAADKSLHDAAEAETNYGDQENFGNMELIDSASIDTLTGNKCGDATNICCSSNKRVSSSPGKIETAKSCLSTGKDMVVGSVVTQEMSKASADNAARSNHGVGRRNRSCQDTSKNRENDAYSNKRVSSSPGKIETAKSCLSTGKDMVVGSVVTQEMSKASANNAARSNHGVGRRNKSCQDTSKNRENDA